MPEVANLIVQPRGQSQQMQIINGTTTVSVTYNYAVGSNTPGDYQIPAIDVMVDGKKLTTRPLKLKVLAAAAAQPPAGHSAQPARIRNPPGGGDRIRRRKTLRFPHRRTGRQRPQVCVCRRDRAGPDPGLASG